MSHRAPCPGCGGDVIHAITTKKEPLILEPHESPLGPGRYSIWTDGYARGLSATAEILGHDVHECEGLKRFREDYENASVRDQ